MHDANLAGFGRRLGADKTVVEARQSGCSGRNSARQKAAALEIERRQVGSSDYSQEVIDGDPRSIAEPRARLVPCAAVPRLPRRGPVRSQLLKKISYRVAHHAGRLRVGIAADQVTGDRIDRHRSRVRNRSNLGFDVLRRKELVVGAVDEQRLCLDRAPSAAFRSPSKPGVLPTQPARGHRPGSRGRARPGCRGSTSPQVLRHCV